CQTSKSNQNSDLASNFTLGKLVYCNVLLRGYIKLSNKRPSCDSIELYQKMQPSKCKQFSNPVAQISNYMTSLHFCHSIVKIFGIQRLNIHELREGKDLREKTVRTLRAMKSPIMSTPNSILNELNNLDSPATLKILFCVHFTLTTFSLFGALFSQAYMFYNSFLLIFLLWAQYSPVEKSDFPLFHSMIINGQALLFDIIMLTTGYSFLTGLSTFGYSKYSN
uniref:Uncharacterized protein n=1 Tax=Romanomermis culicivorax TaxID=13658 RepID=A0A915JAZ3_ROMCU